MFNNCRNVEARCCCINPARPPPDKKVVTSACLDGARAIPKLVSDKKGRYIWIPPPVDNRPPLDPTVGASFMLSN